MDAAVVEFVAQAPEVLRDHRGTIVGRIEHQRRTGKLVARDAQGVVVGSYDTRSDVTRDAHGWMVGRGNLLGVLILRGR